MAKAVIESSHAETKCVYDRLSRWYDWLSGGFEDRHREVGVRMLAPAVGESVLEVGPGTGHSLVLLAERVGSDGRVWGVDLSEGMLAVARERVRRAGVSGWVRLICGDGIALPFSADLFDGLYCSFTLELFDTEEIPRFLGECRRVLKKGGRLCVVALDRRGEPNLITRLYLWAHRRFPRYIDCRPIPVKEILTKSGFRLLERRSASLAGLPVAYVLAEA